MFIPPPLASDTLSSEDESAVEHMLLDEIQCFGSSSHPPVPCSDSPPFVGIPPIAPHSFSIGHSKHSRPKFPIIDTHQASNISRGSTYDSSGQALGPFLKRKRENSFNAEAHPVQESKKQRKKRRRLERLAAAADMTHRADESMEDTQIYLPYSVEEVASTSILGINPVAGPSTIFPPPTYEVQSIDTSSSWVSSMAMAGNSRPARPIKPPPTAPASWVGILPPKPPPPPPPPIGMPPDPDPKSKHGVFCAPATISRTLSGAKTYIPNPARTLVMEQIPKPSRSVDFINAWARDACGAPPIHVEIDTQWSKALMEFPTADMARLAWNSPRLQRDKLSYAPKLSKVDLIRVWWYRVDGISTGVGEIEEGEIEGEVEKELPRKETKKERKARLARDRETKQCPQPSASPPRIPPTNHTAIPSRPIPTQPKARGLPSKPIPALPSKPISALPAKPILALPSKPPRPINFPLLDKPASAVRLQSPAPGPSTSIPRQSSITSSSTSVDDGDAEVDMEVDSPSTPSFLDFVPVIAKPATSANIPLRPVLEPPREPRHHQAIPQPKAPLPNRLPSAPSASMRPSSAQPASALPTSETSTREPSVHPPAAHETVATPSTSSALSRSIQVKLATQPPSEPRAMKNAPKQPRSFIARQKELEERIAKGKAELSLALNSASQPKSVTTASSPSPPSDTPPEPATSRATSPDPGSLDRRLEDNLRLLVLKSQKSKKKSNVTFDVVDPRTSRITGTSTVAFDVFEPGLSPPLSVPSTPPLYDQFSLDNLAESFISESIKEAQASPRIPATIPATKHELAAKQKQLEKQIAESKLLMAKLSKARTKEEKDSILMAMREQSRLLDDVNTSRPVLISKPSFSRIRVPWPECQQQTILELSDSEDSDFDDE